MTRAAVRRFQRAWAGGKGGTGHLVVDGALGPKTMAALRGLPWLSPHFTVGEVASKGNGAAYVRRELLDALERLRAADGGRGLPLLSVYRDPAHNARVGGATSSQHLGGLAADLVRKIRLGTVLDLRLFSGVGTSGGLVRHVDLRHLASGGSPTGGTPSNPTRWSYGA